jgi:hypothetical protein
MPMTDFDPAEHKVPEVLEYVEKHPDEADAILKAEAAGKDRTTIEEALAEPAKEARASRRATTRTARSGKYTLQAGDTPSSVARALFGRASRGTELYRLNPDVKWQSGVEINVPSN